MEGKPKFLQGTISFQGKGFDDPIPLRGLTYTVPQNMQSQLVYFRAGNSSDELVNLTLTPDGETMRLFPLGMKSAMHFPLAIQEFLPAATHLELNLTAAEGQSGSIFVDIGFMEHLAVKSA